MSNLRLVALMRLSSSAQVRGHGPTRQEENEIKAYADELEAIIVDSWSVSERATIFERPQFTAALKKAVALRRQAKIDGVILGSVDRLSRDPFDGGAVCRDALNAGLRLLFAAERLDASKEEDQGNIINQLVASRAYARRLRAQTAPARRARAKVGKIPNGQCRWPLSYDATTGMATPFPERVGWIRRWYEELQRGGSLGSIKKMMEQAHVPAPKGGTVWSRSTIRRILADPALKGEFYFGFERMQSSDYWEPSRRAPSAPELIYIDKANSILTDDEWDYIQVVLARNKEHSIRNVQHDYSPLRGLVVCQCGRKVGAYTHHRGGGYFRCGHCRNGDASVAKLWASVSSWLLHAIESYDVLAAHVSAGVRAPETREQIKDEVANYLAELQNLEESFNRAIRIGIRLPNQEERVEGEILRLEERKSFVQTELAARRELLNRLEETEDTGWRIQTSIDQFRERLPHVTDSEWRQLLLDLGLTVEFTPRDEKAAIRVRILFTSILSQMTQQPLDVPQGQVVGGVVSLHP